MSEEASSFRESLESTPILRSDDFYEEHADSFFFTAITNLTIAAVLNVIFVLLLNLGAIAFIIPINLYISYRIICSLFSNIDNMIVERIQKRESDVLEE